MVTHLRTRLGDLGLDFLGSTFDLWELRPASRRELEQGTHPYRLGFKALDPVVCDPIFLCTGGQRYVCSVVAGAGVVYSIL